MRSLDDILSIGADELQHGLSFQLANTQFKVASSDVRSIERLAQYIVQSEASIEGTAAYEVLCIPNEQNYDHIFGLLKRGRGTRINVKSDITFERFDFDGCQAYLARYGCNDEEYAVVRQQNKIIVVSPQDGPDFLMTPLRVIREVMLRNMENAGGVFCHGAVVVDPSGNGTLLLGESGAGKSTVMWRTVSKCDFSYVANDRCILYRSGEQILVLPWPIAIRLGVGTIMDSSSHAMATVGYERPQPSEVLQMLSGASFSADAQWKSRTKLELTPLEAFDMFGVSLCGSATIKQVAVPALSLDNSPLRLQHLDEIGIGPILRSQIRTPFDESYLRGWLGIRNRADEFYSSSALVVGKSLSKLPCFSLSGDPRVFNDSELADAMRCPEIS